MNAVKIEEGASHFGTFGKDKGLKPLVLSLGKLGLRQSEMLPIEEARSRYTTHNHP